MTISTLRLENPHVELIYDRDNKDITAFDKDDQSNLPACYTTRKRGLAKVWATLTARMAANADMTHRDVMTTFTQAGILYHYWLIAENPPDDPNELVGFDDL
jgi:hypothetical protein